MKLPANRLGLGGAALGVLFDPIGDDAARAVVAAAWDAGIRAFDTSPLYGGGLSEERFGAGLSGRKRDDYFLSTKTGVSRPYGQAAAPPGGKRRAADIWDYSPEGTRASIARSLARLNTDRLDLVHLHDVEGRTDAAMAAYPALSALREKGVVGAIGIGANRIEAPLDLMARAKFDAVLVAGRYSLLDQSMLDLVPIARAAGTKLIVGGVFNSGILATGAVPRAMFHYDPAPEPVLQRTRAIEALCRKHAVPLRAAALQFPLAHPDVAMLLLGPRHVDELADNLALLAHPIPAAFWRALQADGLIDKGCPLP
jgi:D-threo-aldose 1-dehydrogenase